jgi:hypothetical protein
METWGCPVRIRRKTSLPPAQLGFQSMETISWEGGIYQNSSAPGFLKNPLRRGFFASEGNRSER